MKNFEEYERIVAEVRKFLFNRHTQEEIIDTEYMNKGGIHSGLDVVLWRNSELERVEELFKNSNSRILFLESWSKGDFKNCDYHFSKF